MSHLQTARWALATGLAFIFIYFGIDQLAHSDAWAPWVPAWLDGLLGYPALSWLRGSGALCIGIGIFLLFPNFIVWKTAALLATILIATILAHGGWDLNAVRNIGLLAMSAGLWFLPEE